MKENKISIEIDCPVEDVFKFTTDPKNTHLWIENIVEEKTDEWPIKIGTIYQNIDKERNINQYEVVRLEPNKIFELKQENNLYFVRYEYESIPENKTKLIYFEWVNKGKLDNPFPLSILEKLKQIME